VRDRVMPPDAAAPAWELWGTFSPADHLRRRAFVADVLIYDKLVVPVPAEDDEELLRKWERRWNRERQAELLEVIDAEMPGLVHRVPWTAEHDSEWQAHARRKGLLMDLASGMSRDVEIIKEADPNSPGQLAERVYLIDVVDPRRDRELRGAVPTGDITVVAAYGSYHQFRREVPIETEADATADRTLLSAFAWPLLVPSNSRRSDADLLKEAADLARRPETRTYRRAFHHWRMALPAGTTPTQAAKNLEDIIKSYATAVRRTKVRTRIRQAVLVVVASAGAGVGALTQDLLPVLISGGGSAGIEQYFQARASQTSIPDYLFPGALFHEARGRLSRQ
jgi:hypothetical protein